MSDDFWSVVKGHVSAMLAQQGAPRHGIVASVDPARGTVRVTWDEDNTLSGWLPIAQQAAGNGWGAVTLPVPGTQVFCAPDMGDSGSMVMLGAVHSTQQPPGKVTPYKAASPIPLVPGEPTLIHASGASLRLLAGGIIELHGTVKIDGDLLVSGDIRDKDGVRGTLDLLRSDYNQHHHTNVQTGGSISGTTDMPTP